jgi:hypothetical protein
LSSNTALAEEGVENEKNEKKIWYWEREENEKDENEKITRMKRMRR